MARASRPFSVSSARDHWPSATTVAARMSPACASSCAVAWSQQESPSTRRSGSQLHISSARPSPTARSIAIARRFKDITSGILADQGGADQCSESRLQLVRRFAAAAVLAEQLESRLANGEQIDIQDHALLCSTLARLASRIGIERRARDVTTLADYLQQRQGTAE